MKKLIWLLLLLLAFIIGWGPKYIWGEEDPMTYSIKFEEETVQPRSGEGELWSAQFPLNMVLKMTNRRNGKTIIARVTRRIESFIYMGERMYNYVPEKTRALAEYPWNTPITWDMEIISRP